MGVKLTLIRHGQSIWNAVGRSQGQAPVPLTELGHRQAAAVSAMFSGNGADVTALYSSDLLRCRQTVAPLAEALALPVQYDAHFREIDVGTRQGMQWDEWAQLDPESHAAFIADPLHVPFPQGESVMMMQARVMDGLRQVLAAHSSGHVVVVMHGGPIRGILRHYGCWSYRVASPEEPPVYNTSRTVLDVDDDHTARLLILADVAHLAPDDVT